MTGIADEERWRREGSRGEENKAAAMSGSDQRLRFFMGLSVIPSTLSRNLTEELRRSEEASLVLLRNVDEMRERGTGNGHVRHDEKS